MVPPEAKCAWAPEFSYLAAEKKFYVYWSSIWHGHRVIFYTTTRDWSDLAPARSAVYYYDLGVNDIDLTIREHAGTYYAFHKPGSVADMLGNRLLTSHSLDPQVESFAKGDGPGKDVLPDQSQPTEAPETIQVIGEDRWYVYGDPFYHPMEAWETTDLVTFKKLVVHPPPRSKHCGMIPITEEELVRLAGVGSRRVDKMTGSRRLGLCRCFQVVSPRPACVYRVGRSQSRRQAAPRFPSLVGEFCPPRGMPPVYITNDS